MTNTFGAYYSPDTPSLTPPGTAEEFRAKVFYDVYSVGLQGRSTVFRLTLFILVLACLFLYILRMYAGSSAANVSVVVSARTNPIFN